MFPSLERTIDDFERSTSLANKLSDAVENFISARIAIRDYVISLDEESYSRVEERVRASLASLVIATSLAEENTSAIVLKKLHDAIQEWSDITIKVRDAFSNYQKMTHANLVEGFSQLTGAENTILRSNKLSCEFMLAIQNVNAKASSSLLEGNSKLIENTRSLLKFIRETIINDQKKTKHWLESKTIFLQALDTYQSGIEALWTSRRTAYDLLHNSLAPLGSKIQSDAEAFKLQIIALQLKNGELKKAYWTLEQISLTDPLTGLWNRRFLTKHMDADAAKLIRRYDNWLKSPDSPPPQDEDIVFLLLDMDHFKAVNDQHGHSSGDMVLVQIQQRLKKVFRESDYLVRWGGEEFLIVARGTDRAEAELIAERTCNAMRSVPFEVENGVLLQKTCSVGFACFPFLPNYPHLLSWSQVIQLADEALYIAKHSGRDGWVGLFAGEQTRPEDLLRRVDNAISGALNNGEMHLKTSLKTVLTPTKNKK